MKKIVILDDHKIIRDGLKLMISFENEFDVINDYAHGRECIENLEIDNPDIFILDIILPDMNGNEVIPFIQKIAPNCKIVILSSTMSTALIKSTLKLGATGFLNKECSSEEFLNCLRAVANNEIFLTKDLSISLIENKEPKELINKLSEREKEIFIQLVKGKTYSEIGEMYFISPKTVEKHNRNIQTKLGVSSIVEMVKIAIRENLIQI